MRGLTILLIALNIWIPTWASAQTDPPILYTWQRNTDGRQGTGGDPADGCTAPQSALADVQEVWYTSWSVWVKTTDIPDFTVGPWPGNPNCAQDQSLNNLYAAFTRAPTLSDPSLRTPTPLKAIGLWIDGTYIYDARDGHSYSHAMGVDSEPDTPPGDGIWNRDANGPDSSDPNYHPESFSFDAAGGHPDEGDMYHFHGNPIGLRTQLGDTGGSWSVLIPPLLVTKHSPILGWAMDGYPIYGPFAYKNTDGTGGFARMRSGYRLRGGALALLRASTPGIPVLPSEQMGPPVSALYPLGRYVEDYAYRSPMPWMCVTAALA
jgi:hypothetical protein